MEVVEINGVKYRKTKKKPTKMSKSMVSFLALTGMLSGGMNSKKKSTGPEIDITSEYELIQNKKSKLSRRQRDMVVWMFERDYEKIEE